MTTAPSSTPSRGQPSVPSPVTATRPRLRESGRWQSRVVTTSSQDGAPRLSRIPGRSRRDVDSKVRAIRTSRQSVTPATGSPRTIAQLLERWVIHKELEVRPTSYRRLQNHVRNHLIPGLGHVPCADLTPAQLRDFLHAKATQPRGDEASNRGTKPLSPASVRHLLVTFRAALADAVIDGLLPRNIAIGIRSPRVIPPEIVPVGAGSGARLLAEARRALGSARTVRSRAFARTMVTFLTLALYTGCREGELLGLAWSDVRMDGDDPVLTVRRTLVGTKDGVGRYHPPKTAKGGRTISLDPTVIAALRLQLDHQSSSREVTPDRLVLASLVGTPISAQNLIRGFKRLRERAGLPADTRIHDIRHGSASHLIADGDIATASRILGHSNAYVTLAIYGHMLPHASSRAMARIGALYDAASATLRDEEEAATSGDDGDQGEG